MIDRRQFAKGTASALVGIQSNSIWGAASSVIPSPDIQVSEFHLRDYLGIYDFPEELISYPLSFATGAVRKEDLRLFRKGTKSPLVIQFTDVQETDGFLRSATLHFRTDLKIGAEKTFILMQSACRQPRGSQSITVNSVAGDTLSIEANQLQILVPTVGDRTLNVPVTEAPAPLRAIARENGKWVGEGRLEGPRSLVVRSMHARVVEQGPLFLKYAITYTFSENSSYTIGMTVQQNESYVEIDEFATSLGPDDHLNFQFSYKRGVDPNGRLLMANGGYSTGGPQQGASGAYGEKANSKGLLPIKLGIYTPNSINLPRAIAFWNDNGENAILFALRRLPDWKTSQRALWSASNLPDNLEFYAEPARGDKFVRAPIVGAERHWSMGLIARDEMIVRGIQQGQTSMKPRPADRMWRVDSSMRGLLPYGAGPEVRLLQKLNDFSLNRYKDCIFEFPEDSRTSAFSLPHTDITSTQMSGAEYALSYERNFAFLAQTGWDFSGDMGANHWGWSIHPESINYAYNFTNWTRDERLQARSWLVFAAYLMELDTAMPHSSMLGGHPNFAAEYKQVLGVVAGLFPLHPHAPRWRDSYLKFWTEYLDCYVRKANVETGAKPGRFTESIACYNYASMEAVCMAAAGLKLFDGSHILGHSAFRDWARWDMECRLPFRVHGARIVPPEGAHADTTIFSPGGRWYNAAYALAHMLKEYDPSLADHWLWTITGGAEGKPPAGLESSVFADYGPVFRFDFGGTEEAYLHMQQLSGSGYRWSATSNGALYFAAKGKVWSWNQAEANGDILDVSQLPVLQVGKASLGVSQATGVMYNFGFAQYYRADADYQSGVSPYKSRAVMMVRGDYIAVRDEVEGVGGGSFNWTNESNGMAWQIFSGADFRQPLKSMINDERFPLSFKEEQMRNFGVSHSPFSISSTAKFFVPAAGRYRFSTNWNTPHQDVPAADTVRIYLDEHKLIACKGPATTEIELESRPYTIRFEYVHTSSEPPFLMLSWIRPDRPGTSQIENVYFKAENQMPFVQQVQNGLGSQLHIVAPDNLDIVPIASGGAQIGTDEFVLFTDAAITARGTNLNFSGKAGYAKDGALALFDGTHIEMNGLGLSRIDGEFGASVRRVGTNSIDGRIAGKRSGNLRIHLPSGFPTNGLRGTLDGLDVPVTIEGSRLSIPVTIKQSDGVRAYTIIAQ
jgi:hypothetical protein